MLSPGQAQKPFQMNDQTYALKKKKRKEKKIFMAVPMSYGGSQAKGELELQLLAYNTATATPNLSHMGPTWQLVATPDP